MQSPMDLMVVAYDVNYNPSQVLPAKGVTFSNGGSYAITGAWQTMQNFNANFTNIPSAITGLSFYRYAPDGYAFASSAYGNPANNTLSVSTQVPTLTSMAHAATRSTTRTRPGQQSSCRPSRATR